PRGLGVRGGPVTARGGGAAGEPASGGPARRFAGATGAWFIERQARTTLDLLADLPGTSVLDVGGGHGQTAGALVQHGYDVTVLGSAPEACGEALRPHLASGRVRFETGDLARPPFPEKAFDVVLSYRLLAHAEAWTALGSALS